ncbi:MAG: 6-bladed beta-propeller [Candidatus Latescibacterota bacterium]|nr:MAG: 6-bladed beta-propeller [Candidatus Latescibacterota bacterium]
MSPRCSKSWLCALFICIGTAAIAADSGTTGSVWSAKQPSHPSGGYDLRSMLSLGGPDAPDEEQFYEKYEPIRVDADADGNIYVLDGGNIRIQVFDAEGNWLRSIGQEGEGPGEFKMPARLSVNATGSCAVFDMSGMRISIFDAQGNLVRDQVTGRPVRNLMLRDDGSLVCVVMVPGGVRVDAFSADGETLWTHGNEGAPSGGPMVNIENSEDHLAGRLGLTASGVVVASNDEYGLTLLREGELLGTMRRPFDRHEFQMPQPSSDEEGGDDVQVVMIRRGGGDDGDGGRAEVHVGGDGETMSWNGQELRNMMPKYRPDLRGALAWPDGRIWALTADNDGDRIVVDEWSDQGDYTRRFSLTGEYDWFELGADGKLYAVSHDEEDYPIVHRLHVGAVE